MIDVRLKKNGRKAKQERREAKSCEMHDTQIEKKSYVAEHDVILHTYRFVNLDFRNLWARNFEIPFLFHKFLTFPSPPSFFPSIEILRQNSFC